jgi:hypothetical protein
VDLARRCLALIRDIADCGVWSHDRQVVGYALQELSQVLLERRGMEERVFEPASAEIIAGLPGLLEELEFVEGAISDQGVRRCQ